MRPLIALVLVLAIPALVEAGLFRRRNGEPRRPVQKLVRGVGGHCHNGACK